MNSESKPTQWFDGYIWGIERSSNVINNYFSQVYQIIFINVIGVYVNSSLCGTLGSLYHNIFPLFIIEFNMYLIVDSPLFQARNDVLFCVSTIHSFQRKIVCVPGDNHKLQLSLEIINWLRYNNRTFLNLYYHIYSGVVGYKYFFGWIKIVVYYRNSYLLLLCVFDWNCCKFFPQNLRIQNDEIIKLLSQIHYSHLNIHTLYVLSSNLYKYAIAWYMKGPVDTFA